MDIESRNYYGSNISEARKKYRYLNASNRKNEKKERYTPKEKYYNDYSTERESNLDEEKVAKEFRRLVISVAVVCLVVVVKVVDNNFMNGIENKITYSIRTTSEWDKKISKQLVYLGGEMGINLNDVSTGKNNIENVNVEENIQKQTEDTYSIDAENADDLSQEDINIEDLNFEGIEEVNKELDFEDDQIADFYIDEDFLDEVLNDGKK